MTNTIKEVSKKPNLEPAKAILKAFIDERTQLMDVQRGMTPLFSTVGEEVPKSDLAQIEIVNTADPYWEKENARAWIYAASRYIPLMRRPKKHQVHPFYEQTALPLFKEWHLLIRDVCIFPKYCIPNPIGEEALHGYLERLRSIIVDKGERRKIWWHSLRSFTDFLRKKAKLVELWGDLDIIFPEEMTIYSETIIRKVPPTIYPIDILAVAEILQNLAKHVFEGPSHAQESAAQALGLAWVCLTSGLARFMTRLEILHQLLPATLKSLPQDDPFKPNYWLTIPSLFGKQDTPISKTLYDYLQALPRTHSHYLFGMPLGSLRRALDRAIHSSQRAQTLGKITFLTFMSEPHEAIGHRFQAYAKYQVKSISKKCNS
jgi:hypothetical protein